MNKVIKKLVKAAPRPTPPAAIQPEFRPMTQDVWRVKIPKIKKLGPRGPKPVREPSVRFIISFSASEKDALARTAQALCLTQATLVRLAVKRFLRMPETALRPQAQRLWDEGIRRDMKQISARAAYAYACALLREAGDGERPLSMKHLEHKLAEAIATNTYRKTKRTVLQPTGRRRVPGNPKGINGRRVPDVAAVAGAGGVADRPVRDEHSDTVDHGTPAARVVPAPGPTRRIMIIPRKG